MYPFAIVSLILALITGGVMLSANERQAEHRAMRVQAVASNLTVYAGFVGAYVGSTPHVSGWIDPGSVGHPSWFVKHGNVSAFRSGTSTYVFASGLPQWQVASMSKEYAQGRPFDGRYGIKQAGVLRLRNGSQIPVPSQVPDGSFLVVL